MTFVIILFLIAAALVTPYVIAIIIDDETEKTNNPISNHQKSLSSIEKGEQGEHLVAYHLNETNSIHKRIINNIVIKTAYDRTSQIDHILINEYGIFVIETKNYDGLIFGNYESKFWNQYIGVNNYTFYNPIMQNETHIKRLKEVLQVEHSSQYKFHSVIVFIKNNAEDINEHNVINLSQLVDYINSFTVKTLTVDEIESVYCTLLSIKHMYYEHIYEEG